MAPSKIRKMDADVITKDGEDSPLEEEEIKMEQEIPVEEEVSDEEVNQRIKTEDASRDNFSSENFKLELQNLPKFFGIGQIKKLINKKLKLNSNKIKPCGQNFMYLCFRNEEDKEKAMMVLNGFTFKGRQLKAVSAKAAADPYKKKKSQPQVVDSRPVDVRLQEVLCPHAKLSYEVQLERKLEEIVTTVKRLGAEISMVNPTLKPLVQRRLAEHGTVAPIQEFLKSPVTRGYRNKCEFSIGYMNTETLNPATETLNPAAAENTGGDLPETADPISTNTPTISVGFRLATYKEGSIEVVSLSSLSWPEDVLPHVSPEMIKIGVMLEQFVAASGILPYNSVTFEGNWRSVMIRSAGDDQLMVVLAMDPKGLSSDKISQVRSDLVIFFTDGAGEPCKVTNLFLHLSPARKPQGGMEPAPELLLGEPVITEKLFDLIFSISPQAFFQVNTKGAEVLYTCVGDLADLQEHSTLVDVCCGTGTIGLCLANRVRKVIGVELVPEAVRDARKNAKRNGVENCSFFAGKAENILIDVLRDIDSKDVVAVVDPPRAGLHNKALSAIRNNLAIKRLVYVSCDAKAAMKNFVDLSRAPSKTCRGDPFFPVKVVPVDLFPHTKQFELVLLFQRVSGDEINLTGDIQPVQSEPAREPEETTNGAS